MQPKIFLINLDRNPERLEFMIEQFRIFGYDFERINATDGAQNPLLDVHEKSTLSQSEKACAHSHRRAYEKIIEQNLPSALIMEDDIELDEMFPFALTNSLAQINQNETQYVQFDYSPVGIKGVFMWWFLFGNLMKKEKTSPLFWFMLPIYICKGLLANSLLLADGLRDYMHRKTKTNRLYRTRKDRYLAGCYLITRPTAEILLKLNTPIQYAADAVQNIARRRNLINHFISVPRPTRQKREVFHSSLNDAHFGKKVISY